MAKRIHKNGNVTVICGAAAAGRRVDVLGHTEVPTFLPSPADAKLFPVPLKREDLSLYCLPVKGGRSVFIYETVAPSRTEHPRAHWIWAVPVH